MVSGAIITYGIARYRAKSVGFSGIKLAVIIGCVIASYSIVDAAGTRITQSAISYYEASTTANAVLLTSYLMRFHPTVIDRIHRDSSRTYFYRSIGVGLTGYVAVNLPSSDRALSLVHTKAV